MKSAGPIGAATYMANHPAAEGKAHPGLVTVFGGTGFLGRRIVRHLLDNGFKSGLRRGARVGPPRHLSQNPPD
jgi:hypothetical protein